RRLGVAAPRVEAARPGGADLLRAAVDGDDAAAAGDELLREDAVAAAQIEDALARLRGEQGEHAGAEVGDEPRVPGIGVRIPVLCGHGQRMVDASDSLLEAHPEEPPPNLVTNS